MKATGRARAIFLGVAILLFGAMHFAIGVGAHRLHVIHVVFGGLYLLPIVAGALWFGLPGGITSSSAAAAIYLVHVLVSWPNQPMENVNQFAMIGVYLLVGAVAGNLVRRERRAQREVVLQGIASLSNALGFRDEYTREHSERVSRLAVEIGRRRGLSGERLEALRLAALMHDVGKIGVRDDILLKPDQLTAEERTRIERHAALAAEILLPIHGAGKIADIVLSHHECPDGSGYPRGLKGDQIPLEARILRVADVYSALTDARAYKPAARREDAMERILSMSGSKLDMESVEALVSMLGGARASRPEGGTEMAARFHSA
jgi:putative nucleotidyltransferase with HDIG domain